MLSFELLDRIIGNILDYIQRLETGELRDLFLNVEDIDYRAKQTYINVFYVLVVVNMEPSGCLCMIFSPSS